MAPEEELARERRAVELAQRERAHAGILRKTANPERPTMRTSLVVLVFAVAGLLAADLQSSSPRAAVAPPARAVTSAKPVGDSVEVGFVKSGRIVRVERVVPRGMTPAHAALRDRRPDERTPKRIRTVARGRGLRSLRATEHRSRAFPRDARSGSAETKRRDLADRGGPSRRRRRGLRSPPKVAM
jgi:hypothetical protein